MKNNLPLQFHISINLPTIT